MTDMDREFLLDDSDVEITDLERPDRALRSRSLRLTPRQQRWSLSLTGVLLVLVAISLLLSTAPVRALVSRTLFPAQSAAHSPDLAFYVRGNPSWGQFTLDGKVIAHPPEIKYDNPLLLAPGSHRITWLAAPFAPQTCLLDVVNATTLKSPCLADHIIETSYIANVPAMIISFFASLNDLPAEQRAPLVQQIQTSISEIISVYKNTEKVYPGEVYAVSDQQAQANPALCTLLKQVSICYARATGPLQAALSLQVDSSTSPTDFCIVSEQCSLGDRDCRLLCNNPTLNASPQSEEGWNVVAAIRLLWTYTTPSGQVVARDQPNSAFRGASEYQLISLHIDLPDPNSPAPPGHWWIAPFADGITSGFTNPLCTQALQDTEELIHSTPNGNQSRYVQQSLGSNDESWIGGIGVGCLEITALPSGTGGSLSTPAATVSQVAYCLVRFGMILAANQVAHQLWPYLPVVDAYEKSAVQNLLTLLP